jgi:hypothetical protein
VHFCASLFAGADGLLSDTLIYLLEMFYIARNWLSIEYDHTPIVMCGHQMSLMSVFTWYCKLGIGMSFLQAWVALVAWVAQLGSEILVTNQIGIHREQSTPHAQYSSVQNRTICKYLSSVGLSTHFADQRRAMSSGDAMASQSAASKKAS